MPGANECGARIGGGEPVRRRFETHTRTPLVYARLGYTAALQADCATTDNNIMRSRRGGGLMTNTLAILL